MTDTFIDIIRFVISFCHVMAASTWFAGSLISLNINNLIKIHQSFETIFSHFINWTNTIISTLVLTGVILILDSISSIDSKLYIFILILKLFLFIWIALILYTNKYKSYYFNNPNIYNNFVKLLIQSKLIFPITVVIFLLSELLNIIRI